jgi:hypothetical protein
MFFTSFSAIMTALGGPLILSIFSSAIIHVFLKDKHRGASLHLDPFKALSPLANDPVDLDTGDCQLANVAVKLHFHAAAYGSHRRRRSKQHAYSVRLIATVTVHIDVGAELCLQFFFKLAALCR